MARTKNTTFKADMRRANWESEYLVKHEKKWVDEELATLVKPPMVLPVQQAALDKVCLDLCNLFKYESDQWNTSSSAPRGKLATSTSRSRGTSAASSPPSWRPLMQV